MPSPEDDILPEHIQAGIRRFCRETSDGHWEVIDKGGLLRFISENQREYPALAKLVKLDQAALLRYWEEHAGEPLPGVTVYEEVTAADGTVYRRPLLWDETKVKRGH